VNGFSGKVGFCGDGWKVLILRGLRAGCGVFGEVEEHLAVGEVGVFGIGEIGGWGVEPTLSPV